MSPFNLLEYAAFLVVVTLLVKPVGGYLHRVFEGQRTFLAPLLRPLERFIYKISGVDEGEETDWKQYAVSFVLFGLAGALALYLLLRAQQFLPYFFPEYMSTSMTPDLAMNTAVGFATATTWQAYAGETTMSYLTQLVGLTAQNFLAGASGLAVGVAFMRGFARERAGVIGNFWVDVTRAALYVMLPLAIPGGLFLVWQGVPMNFNPYTAAATLDGATQVIPQGPVAGLEFIKYLGTNGGGFFNANGAHPFANPTPLSNFVGMLAIVVIPAAMTNTFGRMVNRPRQGWALYKAMVALFAAGLLLCGYFEERGNAVVKNVIAESSAAPPNMEGKETRFGVGGSTLAAVATSNGATGSYNSMHDSFTPLGGGVLLANMLLGELVFGGLGTGFYSIVMTALVGLFLAGLMIGRKPEYLGKEVAAGEMKLILLYALAAPLFILVLTAVAVSTEVGLAGLTTNAGAHGLTEILYAYTSSFANNGQNFAGLSANSPFYNLTTALAMVAGRFGLAIPALALAGLFAAQGRRKATLGTLPTDTAAFVVIVIGAALIVGGLSYFPVLALGPIIEHLLMVRG